MPNQKRRLPIAWLPSQSPGDGRYGARAEADHLGAMTLAGSPADFGKLIADETEKWGKVVKFSGIKPE